MNRQRLQNWLDGMNHSEQDLHHVCDVTAPTKPILNVGILLVSEKYGNTSNPTFLKLQEVLLSTKEFRAVIKVVQSVSNDQNTIKNVLSDWADSMGLHLILTSGGTGFSRYDVTPEATRAVIEKEALSMVIAVTLASLKVTTNAMISRAICGLRNNVLIINLPGSSKASGECLSVILPALSHHISTPTEEPTLVQDHIKPAEENLEICFCCSERKRSLPLARRINSSSNQYKRSRKNDNSINSQVDVLKSSADKDKDDQPQKSPFKHSLASTGSNFEGDRKFRRATPVQQTDFRKNKEGLVQSANDFTKVARRVRASPYPLIPFEKALSLVLENSIALPVSEKHYREAFGCVLAKDVLAKEHFPSFSSAAVDGYAVRANETPNELMIVENPDGFDSASFHSPTYLPSRTSIRITSGAPLPMLADAVVPEEYTLPIQDAETQKEFAVRMLKRVACGENVLAPGHHTKKGDIIVSKGSVLESSEIGSLASSGINSVMVHNKPTVAVFSTGREINDLDGSRNKENDVSDVNRISLLLYLRKHGFKAIDMGSAKNVETIKDVIFRSCKEADVIVSSGGVSVGENDHVKPILENIGAKLHFGRVLMKPGKPTTFGTLESEYGRKLYFGLPGNPVATCVTFNLFVLPSLHRLSGHAEPQQMKIKVKVSFDIRLAQQPEYQRVKLRWESNDSIPWADTTGKQGSSRLLSMVGASALLTLPPKSLKMSSINRGQVVDAVIIDKL